MSTYHPQLKNSVLSRMDLGKLLVLAVKARQAEKDSENDKHSRLISADHILQNEIKACAIGGRYARNTVLLSDEDKISLMDYMLEYHVDWGKIAEEVLKNFE